MEGAPQQRQERQVVGRAHQVEAGDIGITQYLARFLEEDLAHLVVLGQLGLDERGCGRLQRHRRGPRRRRRRCRQYIKRGRLGRRSDKVDQGFGQLIACRGHRGGIGRVDQRLLRLLHGGGERRLIGHHRLVRQQLEFARDLGHRHIVLRGAVRERLGLLDQAWFDRRDCHQRVGRRARFAAAHHRAQRAGVGIEAEQRLGHLRLHAEHVDQETQGTHVAGQALKHTGLRDTLRIDLGLDQAIDLVAHTQERRGGLIHAEHRKHAAHRRELVRHRDQHLALERVAEELVDQLLGLGQRRAQLLHHAAHGLTVGDAAVQLLHPALERLGRFALAHGGEPLGEALDTIGQLGVVEVAVFERGLDVEQAGRDFHRQRRRWRSVGLLRLGDGLLQLLAEGLAMFEEAFERIADERELLAQTGQAVHLATSHRRPRFLGRDDALACLGDPGRVEPAERADRVVDRLVMGQTVDLAHRGQPRRLAAVARRGALGAEKQQVLCEPLGHLGLATLEHAVLRQQTRCHAFAEHIEAEQAVGLRFVHRCGEFPHRCDRAARRTGAETGADVTHLRSRVDRQRDTHQRQQLAFERAVGRGIGLARRGLRVGRHITPAPVERPQIGRVHTLGTRRFLHRAVLREQRQRRHRLAGKQTRQIVEQRERGLLDVIDNRAGELVRLGDKTLHCVLARAQHGGGIGQADQLERADPLVDLHPCRAQHGRVDRIDTRAAERFAFFHETAQRLVGRFERAAQFVLHPGQGAEVVVRLAHGGAGVHAAASAGSCWCGLRLTRS